MYFIWLESHTIKANVVQDRNVLCVSLFDEAPNKYVVEASDLLALAWSEGIKATAKL